MDGMHDMGGRQGFGPVRYPTSPHGETWEARVRVLLVHCVTNGVFTMDEYRHAVERLDPVRYLTFPYFDRSLTAIATLFVEKNLITEDGLAELVNGDFPLARPIGPGRHADENAENFEVGDRVRVRDEFVGGHHRMPAYIRGGEGVVVGIGPLTPFPDAAGHGLDATSERTYDVRFRSRDLWGDDCDDSANHVGVFESYLHRI